MPCYYYYSYDDYNQLKTTLTSYGRLLPLYFTLTIASGVFPHHDRSVVMFITLFYVYVMCVFPSFFADNGMALSPLD